MKSIVHEASSIAKAIEQGLIKAGNPRDFAIKILEYPQKNFFGLTTKPAKIALYYDDRIRKQHEPYSVPHGADTERTERPRDRNPREQHREQRSIHPRDDQRRERAPRPQLRPHTPEPTPYRSHQTADTSVSGEKREQEEITPRWTPETVRYTKEWLTRVLTEMHRLVPFTVEMNNLCLRITLDRPLFEDPEHERKVLASLSLLLIESSKHVFKLNLRGHKVLLTHRS